MRCAGWKTVSDIKDVHLGIDMALLEVVSLQ